MSRPRTLSTKSKPSYPRLSFVPETPPAISNFPIQAPLAAFSSPQLFSASPTARKLVKRRRPDTKTNPENGDSSFLGSAGRTSAPPSAFRYPYAAVERARPESQWTSRQSDYRGQRSVSSDIGHVESPAFVSDSRSHRRLSFRSSRFLKRVSTHFNGSAWSHRDKEQVSTNQDCRRNDVHRSWTEQEQLALEDYAAPYKQWTQQNSSESSFGSTDALFIRPPLTRRIAGSSGYTSSHALGSAPISPAYEPTEYPALLIPPIPDLLTPSDLSHVATDSSGSCLTDEFFSSFPSQEATRSPKLKALPPLPPSTEYSKPRRDIGLALAIADEGVSDEALVERLERLRVAQGTPGVIGATCIWDTSAPEHHHLSHHLPACGAATIHPSRTSSSAAPESVPSNPQSRSATWSVARRALLVVRELVRTERHYVASLKQLLEHEASTPNVARVRPKRSSTLPSRKSTTSLGLNALRRQTDEASAPPSSQPSPLIASYARSLVEVGESLLDGFEREMTVTGISSTFIEVMSAYLSSSVATSASTGEAAFVAWCGVVGTWFVGNEEEPVGKRSTLKLTKRKSMHAKGSTPEFPTMGSATFSSSSSPISSSPTSVKSPPRVRDLAILPTQRVMRYVLLFRDLLAHTPTTSPSREVVSKAVDAAVALAEKCDRAQTNSAFLMR